MAKYKHHANPELSKAMHEIARSGAAGVHGDRRTKRNRDRSSQKRNAISEQEAR